MSLAAVLGAHVCTVACSALFSFGNGVSHCSPASWSTLAALLFVSQVGVPWSLSQVFLWLDINTDSRKEQSLFNSGCEDPLSVRKLLPGMGIAVAVCQPLAFQLGSAFSTGRTWALLDLGVGGGWGEEKEAIFEAALSHTLPIMSHKVHSFMDGYILSYVLKYSYSLLLWDIFERHNFCLFLISLVEKN